MFWTMVDLFCTKRLFSQETAFFPDYFFRDKNERNSFSNEWSFSCAINKFRTGTLCRTLNYSAEHLKIPGNYSIVSYLLRIEKKNVIFSGSKKYLKGISCYPRKICKSSPKRQKFCCPFCQGALSLSSKIILQNMSISHARRQIFKEHRNSRPKMFCKRSVFKNFTKFTGKYLCQSPYFNKVAGLRPWGLQLYWKRDSGTGVFLWNLRYF